MFFIIFRKMCLPTLNFGDHQLFHYHNLLICGMLLHKKNTKLVHRNLNNMPYQIAQLLHVYYLLYATYPLLLTIKK